MTLFEQQRRSLEQPRQHDWLRQQRETQRRKQHANVLAAFGFAFTGITAGGLAFLLTVNEVVPNDIAALLMTQTLAALSFAVSTYIRP